MNTVAVKVSEDETRLFGHALITFPQELGSSPRLRLSIMRKSKDAPYLGDAGWQARPATVDAMVVSRSANSATVVVGPEVCDQIPVDLQVKIEVEGHDIEGSAFWPPIPPSPGAWSQELTPFKTPTPQAIERELEEALEQAVELPRVVETQEQKRQPVQPPKKRRRYLYLLIPLALLVAGGGYYIADSRDWFNKPEPLLARFERLKLTDTDGVELFALSGEAYREGDGGIGLQAINLAMERGNKDAKLEIARWYDPSSFDPTKADRPDANRAARAYFELSVEGQTAAKELLRSLCAKSASSPQDPGFNGFLTDTYCEGTLE
ncbi:hypothetical protein JQK88_16880 [Mesorhizobium caraganae]|uniref:hypothetical protein n=1 Tax=Mesorhizobium caraganae TaxID=483206 RepID=UPI00177F3693|nr:hypothetical protein [Mesorhizobium caraganae]MBM2712862.1 hypothetical protein [Mesorhizobium caraganae]